MNSSDKSASAAAADLFDLLPDAIVSEIFNRVQDAKSLCVCASVCKRFEGLIPQTYDIHLAVPRREASTQAPHQRDHVRRHGFSSSIKGLINKVLVKPIQFVVQQIVSKKSCSHCDGDDDGDDFSFRSPTTMLKNFKDIRHLVVELPSHEGDISSNSGDAFLKWTAGYGRGLDNCVMLGATSLIAKPSEINVKTSSTMNGEKGDEEDEISLSDFTNEKLKLRVVWTISCLIAASARHHMLKQIVSENRSIRRVEITDGSKQGRICMQGDQVEQLRKSPVEADETERSPVEADETERSPVPPLRIKMWYVPELELPESGYLMKGATLAVIRPAGENRPKVRSSEEVDLALGAFEDDDGCFREAVRKMIKRKKAYRLEMNSF